MPKKNSFNRSNFFSYFFKLMKSFTEIINSALGNYSVDASAIQFVQGRLNEERQLNGWILLILSNRECVVLKFYKGEFMNEGYVLNQEKVLKVLGNQVYGNFSYNEQSVEKGTFNFKSGERFEGLVLKRRRIPFGYGEIQNSEGLVLYKGIVINWRRFGYGTSYHDNGLKEYEGYWCNNRQFGIGIVYDEYGKLGKEHVWCNGFESDYYGGDGSKPMNIGIQRLKLTDNCVLDDWDVSWFLNLESLEIGNDCFGSVKTFKIEGMKRLKSLKIGNNSFTQKKNNFGIDKSKSFHILNCESLESIRIGEYSFSDFGGDFELKNLPQLKKIKFGKMGEKSCNFIYCSFVAKGMSIMTYTS